MNDETIRVGQVSRGTHSGASVQLPIVDLLTGRGFVTGKSGSGKSNSASVIAEKLLDRGYSLLVVDVDGEYYGLKEEYEILHVGGDDECDLRVDEEHAGKLAELALERNVPIILDLSSFLDESKARDLLTAVTKQLFVKEKKRKQPFLMLVEEVHEYIPEGGSIDECGRMLIKVGKRGRKHGLGVVGISQRPANVKKDFITQCDWLCWHRLTWKNDTKVVGRILGSEYADYVQEMDDGECFLTTDWSDDVRVVQFERKRTFDAGATPGLDDVRRPNLKSVSGDLVEELREITDDQERRQSRIEELETELEAKEERIEELETELSEARDLSEMADRFSRAMMEQTTGRTLGGTPGRQSELDETDVTDGRSGTNTSRKSSDAITDGKSSDAVTSGRSGDGTDGGTSHDGGSGNAFDLFANDGTGFGGNDEANFSGNDQTGFSGSDATETDQVTDTTERRTSGDTRTTGTEPPGIVSRLSAEIDELDDVAVAMLRHYRDYGPTTPQEAHESVGGSGDRTKAYAANRALRQRGLVEHVGRGTHDYALPSLVVEESKDPFAPNETIPRTERERLVREIESSFVPGVRPSPDATAADGSRTNGSRSNSTVAPWPDP